MNPIALIAGSVVVYLGGVLTAHVLLDKLPQVKERWNSNTYGGRK
jgi:hypothetical protein